MTFTIEGIAARLDALGYHVTIANTSLSIYDTRVWWRWPTGEELCADRPSVLTDNSDQTPHWRWRFEPGADPSSPVWLSACKSGIDPCDILLTHLRPPGDIAKVIYRSPMDLRFGVEPLNSDIRAEGTSQGWWQAWHTPSLRARIRLTTARLRHGDSRQVS